MRTTPPIPRKIVLFLDYDGVLHPDAAYLTRRGPVLRAEGELFMWAPILVELLRPYPDVQIVLSTSWVRMLGFGRARDYLPVDLRSRVIGGTWHSAMGRHAEGSHRSESTWFTESSRYEQIARFISRAGGRANHWLAIDDDAEEWADSQRLRLVETDGDTGLSSPLVQNELRAKLLWLREAANVDRV